MNTTVPIVCVVLAGLIGTPTLTGAADHAEAPLTALETLRFPATSISPGGKLLLIVENRGQKGSDGFRFLRREHGSSLCSEVELVVLVTPYIVNGNNNGAVLKDIVTTSLNDMAIPAGKALFFPIVNVEAASIAVQFRPETLDACDVSLSLQGFDDEDNPTCLTYPAGTTYVENQTAALP